MSIESRSISLLSTLFSPDSRLRWWVLGALYLFGLWYWLHSFGVFSTDAMGGSVKPVFGYLDWPRNLGILEVIKDAVQRNELPYLSSMKLLETNQLLAVPEVPITPQQFMLKFMSADAYVIVNALGMYTIGFVGLVLFSSSFKLSVLSSSLLYLMFMFNGHVISHLAIGHTMWVAYFLLPFLMYLCFRVVDRSISRSLLVLLLSGVQFAILLQGALHIFVITSVFVVGLGLVRRDYGLAIIGALLVSLLMNSFRLLPAITHFDFPGLARFDGYSSPIAYADALLFSHDFTHSRFGSLRWWEYDSYLGIIGTLLLTGVVGFGGYVLYQRYRAVKDEPSASRLVILWPTLFLFLLSYGGVTGLVYDLEFPLDLNRTERVPSRFFLMALVPAIFMAGLLVQRLLDRPGAWQLKLRFVSLIALIIVGFELVRAALRWRIVEIESLVVNPSERGVTQFALQGPRTDYHTSVEIGLWITGVVMVGWVLYLVRLTMLGRGTRMQFLSVIKRSFMKSIGNK